MSQFGRYILVTQYFCWCNEK